MVVFGMIIGLWVFDGGLVMRRTSDQRVLASEEKWTEESFEELNLVIALPILTAMASAFSVWPSLMSLFLRRSRDLTSGVMKGGS